MCVFTFLTPDDKRAGEVEQMGLGALCLGDTGTPLGPFCLPEHNTNGSFLSK